MTDQSRTLAKADGLAARNRIPAAAQLYRSLLTQPAGSPEIAARAGLGLAILAARQGNMAAARNAVREALQRDPALLDGWRLLADIEDRAGRADAALDAARRIADLAPVDADCQIALGYAATRAGALGIAERAYRRALDLEPGSAAAVNNLAGVLQQRGRAGEAAELFQSIVADDPTNARAWANLALVREMLNDLGGARDAAGRALSVQQDQPVMRLLLAQIDFREGKPAEALDAVETLIAGAADPTVLAEAINLKGHLLDRQGDYDAALAAFKEAGARRRTLGARAGVDRRRYMAELRRAAAVFTPKRLTGLAAEEAPAGTAVAPIFFVGFPRSGTTLLETVLAAHPDLVTSGERSPLQMLRPEIARTAGPSARYPDIVPDLPAEAIGRLRALFAEIAADEFGATLEGRRLLDKLPLNIVELPLVRRLFPNAKVIVALRDPRDVCLSAFMQHFAQNDAMANFTDLGATAALYDGVMGLWLRYRRDLRLDHFEYRYEDLVRDPQAVLGPLFEWLGLAWDSDLLERRGEVAARHVATPSRDAVNRPITAGRVARHRHYARALAPLMEILSPYIAEFGYERVD
ncbi:tetratricopeptide repeat-containing sulfotransferase family protein [Oceanibacterium hippocampi]|uniref:Tetratricopeptide repeat protein n=1 Tax=Oceanibacterium hippocampi TaxID=745714 RepID=A0A1Y5RQK7_9PROT|nr:sulfotransferase family protein [Oceanibacterium hippocampi]SLN20350.1 Tetratricopeptide repeat protein [Oceanibacterium hippocampi]